MSNVRIDLRADFQLSFDLYLGNKDAGGADGMAFVLHNDPFGADGARQWRRRPWRRRHSQWSAIQFDTYQNAVFGDIANDHTNFIDTDVPLGRPALQPG